MEGIAALLIILVVIGLLCGPVALIVALVAMSKSNRLEEQFRMNRLFAPQEKTAPGLSPVSPPPPKTQPPTPWPALVPKHPPIDLTAVPPPAAVPPMEKPILPKPAEPAPPVPIRPKTPAHTPGPESLEQRIGTRWILIAGIVTVLFGVTFFLKYAYDHNWLAPWVRVGIIAAAAAVSLAAGEITRRRGYEITAKGTTALGFALLYAAVFSCYRIYGLIDPAPAYAIAVCITIAALAYALILDEVLIAFLSLFGGYLTPILLSTGQNLPNHLFAYVLILSLGAMACAYVRWWRAVNIVAFVGTYLLYSAWFEKFYSPHIAEGLPPQMNIALGWLAGFFVIYSIMPLLYGLIRKTPCRYEDVWMAALNGLVLFYYLYRILYPDYRAAMAYACAGICGFYLVLLLLARLRCPQDRSLHICLLITALAYLTIAMPLYFRMRILVMAWAIEGTILAGIGILYRSRWTQAAGLIATALSMIFLFRYLPLQNSGFRLIVNPAFGGWLFVCAALLTQHLFYRFLSKTSLEESESSPEELEQKVLGDVLYIASLGLLFLGCAMEWHAHCRWNLAGPRTGGPIFFQGMILLATALMLGLTVRPPCPRSMLCTLCAILVSAAGAVYTAAIMYKLYDQAFPVFANRGFVISCLFVAALFVCAWLWTRRKEKTPETDILASAYALGAVVLLCLLLSEQIWIYWDFRNQFAGPVVNWQLKASMYLSILWAVYGAGMVVVGFWRKLPLLRYMALGLFALLLAKIFIYDMSTLKLEYRIAAFLVTGLILVAVSYLYQYGRKKGFFNAFETTGSLPVQQNADL